MTARKQYTPATAAIDVEAAFKLLEGRWKLLILFHLFGSQVRRFSDLQRSIPGITQKMLTQQLRRLEEDGIVKRTDHHEVPPRVDYRLTDWGQALCPALDAILEWAERRDEFESAEPANRVEAQRPRKQETSFP
ncbi:winged helix-turn-helix transcriptional regulator [Archangium gephyra]|uniref:winged helix-turn-helix transcriptional regulator n=1 Tax=Archangium gephyra TaxID=48 RepID=UPI003B7BE58C